MGDEAGSLADGGLVQLGLAKIPVDALPGGETEVLERALAGSGGLVHARMLSAKKRSA